MTFEGFEKKGNYAVKAKGGLSTLINRNIRVSGHRTSMRLERSMWNALEEICQREGRNMHDLCTMVDARRSESSLTAAMRVFVLSYFRAAATDVGHIRAGHGVQSSMVVGVPGMPSRSGQLYG